MKRSLVLLSLALINPAFGVCQGSNAQTPLERISAQLADLRGLNDAFESSAASSAADRKALWFSSMDHPFIATMRPPAQKHDSMAPVSAKRLRHKAPKGARKAYDKAARSKNPLDTAHGLERTIALDPEFAEAHNDLGVAYAVLGRYPEAAAEFWRAIELVPDEPIPRANLAWVLTSVRPILRVQ